jgi:hypothetical protein
MARSSAEKRAYARTDSRTDGCSGNGFLVNRLLRRDAYRLPCPLSANRIIGLEILK